MNSVERERAIVRALKLRLRDEVVYRNASVGRSEESKYFHHYASKACQTKSLAASASPHFWLMSWEGSKLCKTSFIASASSVKYLYAGSEGGTWL